MHKRKKKRRGEVKKDRKAEALLLACTPFRRAPGTQENESYGYGRAHRERERETEQDSRRGLGQREESRGESLSIFFCPQATKV